MQAKTLKLQRLLKRLDRQEKLFNSYYNRYLNSGSTHLVEILDMIDNSIEKIEFQIQNIK